MVCTAYSRLMLIENKKVNIWHLFIPKMAIRIPSLTSDWIQIRIAHLESPWKARNPNFQVFDIFQSFFILFPAKMAVFRENDHLNPKSGTEFGFLAPQKPPESKRSHFLNFRPFLLSVSGQQKKTQIPLEKKFDYFILRYIRHSTIILSLNGIPHYRRIDTRRNSFGDSWPWYALALSCRRNMPAHTVGHSKLSFVEFLRDPSLFVLRQFPFGMPSKQTQCHRKHGFLCASVHIVGTMSARSGYVCWSSPANH